MSTARTKKRAAEAAGFTIKLALGLVFISPLIIGLFFSFQTEQELMSYPLHLLPQHFTLENYQAVFAKVPLLLYLKNSVIVCVIAIFAQVIFATLAAYAFACFEFPFQPPFPSGIRWPFSSRSYALRHFAPHEPSSFRGRMVSIIWT